jgi:colanic acid biosynthesis glycosyl transferase WcaI
VAGGKRKVVGKLPDIIRKNGSTAVRVLVITPFYAPDLGPGAALYAMLCEELVRLGCDVSVISAVPHYPTGRVAKEFRGRLVQRERRKGVDVTRVWVPSVDRARLGLRLLSFFCYQVLAAFVALSRPYDVLLASSPAFEVLLPTVALGVLRRKPMLYSVHEIYPDLGVKVGIFRHPPVIKAIEWMERLSCRQAGYVRVLSEGYKGVVESKGTPESKLAVISDWIDADLIRPLPRLNAFSARWGLDAQFVAMYAGNLGLTQGLDQVVEAARLLEKEPAIRIVLMGDGAAKASLQQSVQRMGLGNVRFIPFQEHELLPWALASADVSLIMLKRGMGTDSVPSKCYSIMASGRPIIASVDEGSDTWKVIQRAGCGLCLKPENPTALAEAILDLFRNDAYRARLGALGRAYVVQHHSKLAAAQEFCNLLRSLSGQEKAPSRQTIPHGRQV